MIVFKRPVPTEIVKDYVTCFNIDLDQIPEPNRSKLKMRVNSYRSNLNKEPAPRTIIKWYLALIS